MRPTSWFVNAVRRGSWCKPRTYYVLRLPGIYARGD